MNRSVKLSLWMGCAGLLAVALLGHWYYWYAPRARAGSPGDGDWTAGVFLGADDLPIRLWIPFPHQNLAALEGAVSDLQGLSAVSSYLLAEDLLSLPSFGPFRMPPARDLVIAGTPQGDRIVVGATVYPLVARLARAAGRLAGNPWLSGGSVELQGRTVEVEWRDGVWLAAQGPVSEGDPSLLPALEPAHALFSLGQPLGPVPGGHYRLDVGARGWRIASADHIPMQVAGPPSGPRIPPGLALVAMSASSDAARDPILRMFVLLSGEGGATEQLTRAVVGHRGSGERWLLPAEKLLSGLGFEVTDSTLDAWALVAYDELAIQQVVRQLPALSGWLESLEGESLELAIWVNLAAARGSLEGLARALSSLPLPATHQIRAWTLAAQSLASLDSSGSLSLRIEGQPPRLELRFERQGL